MRKGCDKFANRYRSRALGQRVQQIWDREGRLNGRQKVSRYMRVPKIMDMGVNQARRHRPSAEIDHTHALGGPHVSDGHEPPLRDPDRRDDRIVRVHRQHRAVDQYQLRRIVLTGSLGPCFEHHARRQDQPQGNENTRGHSPQQA